MTQVEVARKGDLSGQMTWAAKRENADPEAIRSGVAEGTVIVPANARHVSLHPCAIGTGLSTKVNANVGTSSDVGSVDTELEKTRVAVEFGADAVMDLSTGGDIAGIRRAILGACPVPLGTVPIYQAGIEAAESRGAIVDMTADDLFRVIEEQAEEGVDFMTVHCGVTQRSVQSLKDQKRVTDVVSRGGAFLIGWMLRHEKENPLFEEFDRLLELAHAYDFTLSLGDGMRPGSLGDATDRCQIEELITLGRLVERALEAGVQVMVEGPGHMPLDQIVANVQLEKRLCKGSPFYVLGPLVTDIAAGYDHIAAAIGGCVAAAAGADFLCYVTPSEHLSLPDVDDVRDGVIGAKIAAHAADIVKGVRGAAEWDKRMSTARKTLDWEEQIRLSVNPKRAKQLHERFPGGGPTCTMCGPYCAMALIERYLGVPASRCSR